MLLHKVPEASSCAPVEEKFKLRLISSPLMPNVSKIREVPFSWDETKEIVRSNELERFARSEDTTHKYIQFKADLKERQFSLFKHMLTQHLKWFDSELNENRDIEEISDNEIKFCAKSDRIFSCEDDLKVLPNNFPYYFEKGIVHLCVWSKLRIPSDPKSLLGDVSESTRRIISRYVEKTFVEGFGVPSENIVWFRNWDALQSVKAISHIHVLIKGFAPHQLEAVLHTAGTPLTDKDYEELL